MTATTATLPLPSASIFGKVARRQRRHHHHVLAHALASLALVVAAAVSVL